MPAGSCRASQPRPETRCGRQALVAASSQAATDLTPAIFGLIGAGVGALVPALATVWSGSRTRKSEETRAKQEAEVTRNKAKAERLTECLTAMSVLRSSTRKYGASDRDSVFAWVDADASVDAARLLLTLNGCRRSGCNQGVARQEPALHPTECEPG